MLDVGADFGRTSYLLSQVSGYLGGSLGYLVLGGCLGGCGVWGGYALPPTQKKNLTDIDQEKNH